MKEKELIKRLKDGNNFRSEEHKNLTFIPISIETDGTNVTSVTIKCVDDHTGYSHTETWDSLEWPELKDKFQNRSYLFTN